jgi:hypothetical protein
MQSSGDPSPFKDLPHESDLKLRFLEQAICSTSFTSIATTTWLSSQFQTVLKREKIQLKTEHINCNLCGLFLLPTYNSSIVLDIKNKLANPAQAIGQVNTSKRKLKYRPDPFIKCHICKFINPIPNSGKENDRNRAPPSTKPNPVQPQSQGDSVYLKLKSSSALASLKKSNTTDNSAATKSSNLKKTKKTLQGLIKLQKSRVNQSTSSSSSLSDFLHSLQ